jgi:putative acetyltransferase
MSSTLSLRPFLPQDVEEVADLIRVSIEILTQEHYDETQRAAWMAFVDDEAELRQRLSSSLTLLGLIDDEIVGLASLKENAKLDLLYVHPFHVRQGIASGLCAALEKLAMARGAKMLELDASDTAVPFFEKQGFVATSRNTVLRIDQWLANTTMSKLLGTQAEAAQADETSRGRP